MAMIRCSWPCKHMNWLVKIIYPLEGFCLKNVVYLFLNLSLLWEMKKTSLKRHKKSKHKLGRNDGNWHINHFCSKFWEHRIIIFTFTSKTRMVQVGCHVVTSQSHLAWELSVSKVGGEEYLHQSTGVGNHALKFRTRVQWLKNFAKWSMLTQDKVANINKA